jgi:hypothetical protein
VSIKGISGTLPSNFSASKPKRKRQYMGNGNYQEEVKKIEPIEEQNANRKLISGLGYKIDQKA